MNKAQADKMNDRGLKMPPDSDRAVACFTAALRLFPKHPPAMMNLGDAMRWRGAYARARALYESALAERPQSAEAHFRVGMFELLMGNLERGWREYRWRLLAKGGQIFQTEKPMWNGEPL